MLSLRTFGEDICKAPQVRRTGQEPLASGAEQPKEGEAEGSEQVDMLNGAGISETEEAAVDEEEEATANA